MSNLAIRSEQVSKLYRIGKREIYRNFRETLTDAMARPFRALKNSFNGAAVAASPTETIWALKDVSFEVNHGEVVGIIGRNGAGKSTLLKILSRITEPTEGRITIHGRVGSLLEVGTGFHPELTGRENVYLNGAILGMRRAEIARKFDEIIDFAGVEKFLDTAVKYYSSGMYMRLAFAVAAHLEPEILIVDEVLSVGDAQFQKKCLGKMGEVAESGRTVLFVSHNMAAIERLCSKVIVLQGGNVVGNGKPRTMISNYLRENSGEHYTARSLTGDPQFLSAKLCDVSGNPISEPVCTESFVIRLHYVLPEDSPGTRIGIGVLSADGLPLFTTNTMDFSIETPDKAGEYEADVLMPANCLLADTFHLALCLWNEQETFDWQEPAFTFSVDPGGSALYQLDSQRKGYVHIDCIWEVRKLGATRSASAN
ncbi:MAG: ABC transporter ATP-binding protein [Acidobacteria bacterium]|nr:ABC transporter ATP-binding protein [Acidobacteriota bacterium]